MLRDRARDWANPASANSQTGASAPPATITSAAPRLMISAASPMALAEAAQAVTVQVLGPKRLYRLETRPAAILEIICVIVSGLTRAGPRIIDAVELLAAALYPELSGEDK